MTMVEAPTTRGRTIKFTPERIEQIKNLIERGMSREDIAAMIGVTVGSLQVTCSRLGISLRQPRHRNGAGPLPPKPVAVRAPESNGNGPSQSTPESAPRFTLILRRGQRERSYDLMLPVEITNKLAIEASFEGVSIGDLIVRILTEKYK